MNPVKTLGRCCACGYRFRVRTLMLLPYKGAIPGHGWGCKKCGLPMDGICLVLCDRCAAAVQAGTDIRELCPEVCRGYPGTDGRMGWERIGPPHVHDMTKHPEEMPGDTGG